MEIVINTPEGKTIIKVEEKDAAKLIDAIYWFLRDNKIIPTKNVHKYFDSHYSLLIMSIDKQIHK